MPTRTADEHPFAPRPLTREELLAYAEGRLPPERMHEVEAALEADALAREAAEGLRLPGAAQGLAALDALRPKGAKRARRWWWGGAAVAIIAVAWLLWPRAEEKAVTVAVAPVPEAMPAEQLSVAEIEAASEQPESLRIGHEEPALHRQAAPAKPTMDAAAPVDRDAGVEPLAPRGGPVRPEASPAKPLVVRKAKSSRQLVFLHDLKLVHPRELCSADPVLALADAGVSARYADAATQQHAGGEARLMPYLDFMDGALQRFARNDHKGCLDDLRFVLGQYPDDVNALFYAGLCCHNLGLHARARALLQRAAVHPVDVFDEEAAWYHALTLEKLGEREAAREAFGRIAAGGGFYAEQAARKGRAE